jgi:small subunit ribosomal protein S5
MASIDKRKQTSVKNKKNGRAGKATHEVEKDIFEHKILEVRRVTRMYKGGRRLRFSVFVAVGDKNGRVGVALGKAGDIRTAQEKAIRKAKKNLVHVQLVGNTIPHLIKYKLKSARILMKPAAPGTGVVAGSSMRIIAELVGIKDMLGKILGSNNKITNAYATVEALKSLRSTKL